MPQIQPFHPRVCDPLRGKLNGDPSSGTERRVGGPFEDLPRNATNGTVNTAAAKNRWLQFSPDPPLGFNRLFATSLGV